MSKKTAFILLLISIPIVVLYLKMGEASNRVTKSKEIKPPKSSSFERLINSHRLSIGQKELKHDDKLCPFATKRVEKLFTVNWQTLGHFEFEKDADASGLYGRPLQENIVEGPNEESMLQGLLGSLEHKETLEAERNMFTCVAVKNQLVVQIFAEK